MPPRVVHLRGARPRLSCCTLLPLPLQFHAVCESFGMQREAFACADRHNAGMPLLGERVVLMTQVPEEDLLPTAGWQRVQAQAASASTSSADARRVSEADQVEQQQQQQASSAGAAPPGPADFLARYQQQRTSACSVPVGAQGYNAPAPKRARPGEQGAAAHSAGFDLAAYRALLGGPPQPPPALAAAEEAGPAAHSAGAHSASAQTAAAARAGSAGLRPGSSSCSGAHTAAAAAGHEQAQQEHEEAVRVFCVERRGR